MIEMIVEMNYNNNSFHTLKVYIHENKKIVKKMVVINFQDLLFSTKINGDLNEYHKQYVFEILLKQFKEHNLIIEEEIFI